MDRIVVLGKLNQLFKDFVKNVSLKNNLPESIASEAGGKVFSFGSYRLGVHGKGIFTSFFFTKKKLSCLKQFP